MPDLWNEWEYSSFSIFGKMDIFSSMDVKSMNEYNVSGENWVYTRGRVCTYSKHSKHGSSFDPTILPIKLPTGGKWTV